MYIGDFSQKSSMFVVESADAYPEVRQLFTLLKNNKAFVAGGCFKNILKGEVPRDIDIFFNSENDFNEAMIDFTNSPRYVVEYSTPRSIGVRHTKHNLLIDLVRHQYGTPEEVLSTFDFTIAKFAYILRDGQYQVVRHADFNIHLIENVLEISELPNNIDLFFNRIIKYTGYGYKISSNVKRLLFQAIRNMTVHEMALLTSPHTSY